MSSKTRGAGPKNAAHQAAVLLTGLLSWRAVPLLSALAVRSAMLLLRLAVCTVLLLLFMLAAVSTMLLLLFMLAAVPSIWLLTILLLVLLRGVMLLLVLWVGRRAPAVAVLGRWRSVSVLLVVLGSRGAVVLLGRGVVAALLPVGRVGLWRIRALGGEKD